MKNYIKPGQLVRFMPYHEDYLFGYGLKAIADRSRNYYWLNDEPDYDRRVKLLTSQTGLFVKHCPGILSNWDRMPGPHIEHDCIAAERGHAFVLVDEVMLQFAYSFLRRIK